MSFTDVSWTFCVELEQKNFMLIKFNKKKVHISLRMQREHSEHVTSGEDNRNDDDETGPR